MGAFARTSKDSGLGSWCLIQYKLKYRLVKMWPSATCLFNKQGQPTENAGPGMHHSILIQNGVLLVGTSHLFELPRCIKQEGDCRLFYVMPIKCNSWASGKFLVQSSAEGRLSNPVLKMWSQHHSLQALPKGRCFVRGPLNGNNRSSRLWQPCCSY